MKRTWAALGCAAAIAALLTSCSSSKPTAKPAFTASLGQDAAVLAQHVPQCSAIHAEDATWLLPGATSAATCSIDGHTAVIYAWRTATAANAPLSSVNGSAAYAHGTGWSEILTDAGALSLQKQIAGDFASALGGTVRTG